MMENYKKLKRTSRRTALLSALGFLIVIFSLIYSAIQLQSIENLLNEKECLLDEKKKELEELQIKIQNYEEEANQIQSKIQSLKYTQNSLLDFLVSVTGKDNINILDPSVNWDNVKRQIDELPAGKRKNAILNAMLLAWKDIPFTMAQENVTTGFDSPRFIRYVLRTVGIDVEIVGGERLSDTLMKTFETVDKPRPGDLVFFRGQVGSFGFILAFVGEDDEEHVGIGTLQRIAPLQIISMHNINTQYFPLRGYYRVVYPDEKSSNKAARNEQSSNLDCQ